MTRHILLAGTARHSGAGPLQAVHEDRRAAARSDVLNRLAAAIRHEVVRRWARAITVAAALGLHPAAGHAQDPAPVRPVPFVDLDRYAGDWFEIARFPNRFQRECVGNVRATYRRRQDGRLDVVNRCRTAQGETEARGVARIVDDRGFARLKVRFAPGWLSWLPTVWGDYWIIGLASDYSWAVVGEPGRDYLWILARAPHLGGASLAAARAAARASGYDLERLEPTPQEKAGTASARAANRIHGPTYARTPRHRKNGTPSATSPTPSSDWTGRS